MNIVYIVVYMCMCLSRDKHQRTKQMFIHTIYMPAIVTLHTR